MSLNPLFSSVRSFHDFVDVYKANFRDHKMTSNDFVRCAKILVAYYRTRNHAFEIRYSDINLSQSSEPVFRSKMNKMFRTLGLMSAEGNVRLLYSDLYTCKISLEAVRLGGVQTQLFLESLACSQDGRMFGISGRGQDRTTARHERSHRTYRCGTRAAEGSESAYTARSSRVRTPSHAEVQLVIPAILDGFNPFEGVDMAVFETLHREAH